MRKWFERKLGITPDLFAEAKNAAERMESLSHALPYEIADRQLIILEPREKFFEWQSLWEAGLKARPRYRDESEKVWANSRAYLVPCFDSESDLEKFILENRKYLLYSYVGGHAPKERWPWEPSETEFFDWFTVRVVGWGPWDMESKPLKKVPDECVAMGLTT